MASIVVAADEIAVPEATSIEVVKNAKWVALEQELATPQYQVASKANPESTAQYILNKYEGAEAFAAGLGQRIQNGGWNVYYNTASGKQTARTAYNGMYVAAAGTGSLATALAKFSTSAGSVVIGAAALLAGIAMGALHLYSKDCRDKIDNHGNTGTARITLTESRWSSKYDNRW
ncbi:hypothetical protein ACG7HM_001485 [Enterococcus hirae]|nr:hypothetical protein [Enterococcus hirae]EMF0242575.1 hypothetical protein [Enterococcus hirae]EMF0385513.1 hypothetical protein [Enterococcus hirae]EMF0484759.1 hypothetical protein [Enterococcus hirae]HJG02718.1 hypothetical protein [Enterococcus hirae]